MKSDFFDSSKALILIEDILSDRNKDDESNRGVVRKKVVSIIRKNNVSPKKSSMNLKRKSISILIEFLQWIF